VLEQGEGNIQLARQLYKCAVKADPSSERSWLVRVLAAPHCPLLHLQGPCKVMLSGFDAQPSPRQR
jgi:hypothetical protein